MNELQDLVQCPQCGSFVKTMVLQHHIKKRCLRRTDRPTETCTICGRVVFRNKLKSHELFCKLEQERPKELSQPVVQVPDRVSTFDKTGVFYEDENCIVMYQGEVIAQAINLKHGLELLERHRHRFEG